MTNNHKEITQGERPSQRVKRFEALDGFRGIAVLWIVIFHLLLDTTNLGAYKLGVTAFLVISGFSILHSVSRFSWGGSAAISFVKQRLSRIYGPYLLCLLFAAFLLPIAYAMVEILTGHPHPVRFYPYTFLEWIQVVSLVKVFSSASWELWKVFAPLRVNWYLSIIVQMYLIVAFAVLFRSPKFLWFVTFLSVMVLLPSVEKLLPYGLFLPYWLPFSVGMALSYVIRKGYVLRLDRQMDLAWYIGGICAYGAGVGFILWLFYSPFFLALAVGFLLWLVYPIDKTIASWLPWRAFEVIGLMSYSLYLVHMPLWSPISKITPPFLWVPFTVFMSYFWFVFFERPRSLRGSLQAVTRPLIALKVAFHEDWQNVFLSKQARQKPKKERDLGTPNSSINLYSHSSRSNLS